MVLRRLWFTVKLQVEYPFDLSALLPLYDLVWRVDLESDSNLKNATLKHKLSTGNPSPIKLSTGKPLPIKLSTIANQIVDRQTQANQIVGRQTRDNQIVDRQTQDKQIVNWQTHDNQTWP